MSQSSHACMWWPASAQLAHSCSYGHTFHSAIFSVFVSGVMSVHASTGFLVASETSWPFSCSSKLCSLSWELFWLQTQPVWVCVTAGMFSNSVGACLSSAFCFLQHSEVITEQLTKNKRSLNDTADRLGCSTFVPHSSFVLWSWGSCAASFPPSLYLPYLFRLWIPHVRNCLWYICISV